ncbi:hypothetical protein K431DRAFT_281297 [Polychaeton citri CBS 116435]|uniref:Uncharacterized protein n=1 Tax=Polychaeton citri CBS 116435 TaxID=1314669 RepID=A0A9P4QFL8_9PEZI|nr:hypothetical protein K431DRAFT_281297 [Polychaeton citri CBS 116435]
MYTVEHNVKVRSFGMVNQNSMSGLLLQFKSVFNQKFGHLRRPQLKDFEADKYSVETIHTVTIRLLGVKREQAITLINEQLVRQEAVAKQKSIARTKQWNAFCAGARVLQNNRGFDSTTAESMMVEHIDQLINTSQPVISDASGLRVSRSKSHNEDDDDENDVDDSNDDKEDSSNEEDDDGDDNSENSNEEEANNDDDDDNNDDDDDDGDDDDDDDDDDEGSKRNDNDGGILQKAGKMATYKIENAAQKAKPNLPSNISRTPRTSQTWRPALESKSKKKQNNTTGRPRRRARADDE